MLMLKFSPSSHKRSACGCLGRRKRWDLRVLQQLFRLRIVISSDFIIFEEVFLGTDMVIDLEACTIKRKAPFFTPNVVDRYLQLFGRPFVRLWLANI